MDCTLGVSVADLKMIAKAIRKQQALALKLYDTGMMDAMYLAGMVAHHRDSATAVVAISATLRSE